MADDRDERAATPRSTGSRQATTPTSRQATTATQEETPGKLYLAGSGSLALEVAEWAHDAGWTIAGLVELIDPSRIGSAVGAYRVLAPTMPEAGARVALALGGDRREHWTRLEEHGWQGATITHPRAHVSPSALLGEGCLVAPGAVVGAQTTIGRHTLVSRGALIGHHDRIGAFVSLMPGANVGGNAQIEDRATISMGAVIVNGARVGVGATVTAGAVVLKEGVPDGARVQGVPAREYRA